MANGAKTGYSGVFQCLRSLLGFPLDAMHLRILLLAELWFNICGQAPFLFGYKI